MKKETLVTTLGRAPEDHEGIVNTPVYHASTVLFKTMDDLEASESGSGVRPLIYARSGTPATRALEEAIAALDGSDHAILTSSGQSAIVVLLTSMLSSGGHVLLPDSIYGSARKFCNDELKRFGVEITYYDPLVGAGIAALIKPNTQLVYCESPGSQTFEVQDIPAIAAAAHARNIPVAVDNTWATPLFQDTQKLGIDIAMHSCTKYIGGHADSMMGVLTCSKKYYAKLRRTFRNLGVCPGSEEVYLAARGLRTLSVRLKQHQETAFTLANWLLKRPEVAQVIYPALPSDPGHTIWKRDFTGATGLFTIVLKPYPRKAVAAMLDNMKLFAMGFSWGGYESLIVPFTATRTNTSSWKPEGQALRINAGLENVDDLISDLEAGFKRLAAAA